MTNETRKRIEYYKNALPHMKEKVIAAAMMLVIALSVTVTATYAWVTLSTAPEVTSVETTVAANGSLEIALANGTGSAPGKSAVGDSTGAGNKITAANTTWGNLVNLSDPSYGLSKITLRPAALNGTSGLLTNPLYGVGYGEDGRVSSMVTDDDFAYVYYDSTVDMGKGAFLADLDGSHLGVRAISTVKYTNVSGNEQLIELLDGINQKLTTAKNNYASMTNETVSPGKGYITSLEGLIQIYAQNIIDKRFSGAGGVETLDVSSYVPDLYEMMVYFKENVMMPAGDSYLHMANLLDLLHDDGSGKGYAGYDTVDELVAAVNGGALPSYIKNNIVSLNDYTDAVTGKLILGFAKDYKSLEGYLMTSTSGDFSDLSAAQKKNSLAYWAYYAKNGGTVYWSDIQTQINWICDINSATLDGYTLSSLSSMSVALNVLRGSNPHNAIINNGAIFRMEQRIGQKMAPTISVTVDASAVMSILGKIDMDAVLTTSSTTDNTQVGMVIDREKVKSYYTGSFKGDTATAEDTYAMAIDLWVRTNAGSDGAATTGETITETLEDGTVVNTTVTTSAEQAYLTLEGTVVMEEQQSPKMIEDLNGEQQPAYTASFTVDGTAAEKEVFMRYGEYYYLTEQDEKQVEVSFADELASYGDKVSDVSYTPKMISQDVIVGYEGANRVWNEEQMAGLEDLGTSATQGAGSCYVFYADTPADQSRFLELLGSMRVVFVNAQGRQIGTAALDTQNYFAETGKVTVPLVLDKSQAVNLGTDVDGNTTYGLMALTKNAATRVTALIYLDGTKLTNDMVLASGDIQGTLNIQFGSSVALTRTTETTETTTDGETITSTTTDYITGKDSEAIENDTVKNQFVEVSASISPAGPVDYDPDKDAVTTLDVDVTGVEPATVSARFMRKISSTQGVLQDAISLSGSGADWSTTCTFDKPGTYVLRSVWLDGVEYGLDTPIEFTVTGSSVTSLTCGAITDEANNYGMIMTANNSFSTNMTLGFSSSKSAPSKVNGIFMDEDGRQVNVPFYLEGGSWQGTAKFTTSGTFTMKYVEIDGDIYELAERLQPTLEILLGLKVRTWVAADTTTLAKLQSVLETALATNFVLDKAKTGDVTLNISAEIYDNSGNEITGLSNVKLYYGRAGSSLTTSGLDSNLTWSSSTGRYVGNFMVTKAGTYRFKEVTIGTSNTIESYTEAPSIQAMPPEDAYYFNNYTEDYQYAPKLDASMTIGIAYSNAVSETIATIVDKKTGTEYAGILGSMGGETTDQGDKSVNLWSFKVPETNSSQEGEWLLKDITMYGVYYGGQYFESKEENPESTGVTIDLSDKDIETKVANYLYVALNTGSNRSFSGDFMTDHIVEDITVSIADFEGNTIDNLEISDVKVMYYLDSSSVTLDAYGYESDSIDTINVTGEGVAISDTVYQIGTTDNPVNFKYVGLYKTCAVSFSVKDANAETSTAVSVTAGATGSGTKLNYYAGGKLSANVPAYEVKWNKPDVKIKSISPAYGTTFTITSSSDSTIKSDSGNIIMQSGVTNWISNSQNKNAQPYAAVVYLKYDNSNYREFFLPTVTLTLSNAGNNFSNILFEVPNGAGTGTAQRYSFTSNGDVAHTIGYEDGRTMGWSDIKHSEAGKQTITTVQVTGKDNIVWTADLTNDVVINQQKVAPELTFTGLDGYNITTPSAIKTSTSGVTLSQNGDNSMKVTLPSALNWSQERIVEGESGDPTTTTSTSTVYVEQGMLWWKSYDIYTRTVKTQKATTVKTTYRDDYTVDEWKIDSSIYDAEESGITINGNKTAKAMIDVKHNLISQDSDTLVIVTTLDTLKQSGAGSASGSKVSTVYTTETETNRYWE